MRLSVVAALSTVAIAVAACTDREDDVVQAPAGGGAPQPVSDTQANQAATAAAVAFGMTREQLEDADVRSRQNVDLGDVETLILDAQGRVAEVVVDVEGADDIDVVVPIASLSAPDGTTVARDDLVTDLTAEQLRALPRHTAAR